MTQQEQDIILKLAEEMGFRGYDKGFIVHESRVTSEKTLFTKLNFVQALKDAKEFELMARVMDSKVEVLEILRGQKKQARQIDLKQTCITPEEGQGVAQQFKENLSVFKTWKKDGNFDPFSHRSGGLSILLFNEKSRQIVNGNRYSIDAILHTLGLSRDEIIADSIPFAWPVFNPYTIDIKFPMKDSIVGEKEIMALNTATPPKWMTHATKKIKPQVRGFILKLIEHLFPNEEDRERVLDWCHYAIFKRNGTVLCLAGDRGTGKSTFIEILGELVGREYTELVSEAILKDKFNAQFKNKRLIVFEEVALDGPTAINKVKAWCNNKISIEEKGQDAYSADNYSSMVFLLNDLNDLKILPQERRFSIPIVAEENLLTVIPEKEVSDFKIALEEGSQEAIDALAEFGEFLKIRKPKLSEYIPIKGENFNRVADLTMTEWQSHVRDYLISNGEIGKVLPITVILPLARASERGEAMKIPTKKPTIDNFLRDYRYLGKYKLGDVVDISEEDMGKLEASFGIQQSRKSAGKSRRLYGIRPREDFLKAFGLKYKNETSGEDLL